MPPRGQDLHLLHIHYIYTNIYSTYTLPIHYIYTTYRYAPRACLHAGKTSTNLYPGGWQGTGGKLPSKELLARAGGGAGYKALLARGGKWRRMNDKEQRAQGAGYRGGDKGRPMPMPMQMQMQMKMQMRGKAGPSSHLPSRAMVKRTGYRVQGAEHLPSRAMVKRRLYQSKPYQPMPDQPAYRVQGAGYAAGSGGYSPAGAGYRAGSGGYSPVGAGYSQAKASQGKSRPGSRVTICLGGTHLLACSLTHLLTCWLT